MLDLLLTNAFAVLPAKAEKIDVGITGGKIVGLYLPGSAPEAVNTLDCHGNVLLPGAIDTHAHITYCGDYLSGTRAAAQGGVTTVVEMPQSGHWPHVLNLDILRQRQDILAQSGAYADVALWGGIGQEALEETSAALCSAGCAGFKIFTCKIAGGYPCFCHEDDLYRLFLQAAKLDCLITIHAQSSRLLSSFTKELSQKGGAEYFSASQPVLSELSDVNRVCLLSQQTGCKIHICHISSPEILELIAFWQERGADVTAEVCPHYLVLDDTDIVRCGAYAKCGPPLRNKAAVQGMWAALEKGLICTVGTDHATYSEEEKDLPFWSAPGGFPSLDLLYPLLVDEAVLKRDLPWSLLAKVCSENAALRLGISQRKGSIQIGRDADLVLIDPNSPWVYHAKDSCGPIISSRYPYEGRRFTSQVQMTLLRGQIIYQNRQIIGRPIGQFISCK